MFGFLTNPTFTGTGFSRAFGDGDCKTGDLSWYNMDETQHSQAPLLPPVDMTPPDHLRRQVQCHRAVLHVNFCHQGDVQMDGGTVFRNNVSE